MTLVELTLANAFFGLLLVCLFLVFRSGSLAWSRSDASLDLFQDMRALAVRWSNEFCETTPGTVLVGSAELSFASARKNGTFQSSAPVLQPLWEKYIVYYFSAGELRRREVPLPTPASTLLTIEDQDLGSGLKTQTFYASGGEVALKNVIAIDFRQDGRMVTLTMETRRATYQSVQGQTLRLQASARCNN